VTLKILMPIIIILSFYFGDNKSNRTRNFIGIWLLNAKCSDFNGAPDFVASKKLVVESADNGLNVRRVLNDSVSASVVENIDFNGITTNVALSSRIKSNRLEWINDTCFILHASFYYEQDSTKVEFRTVEKWTLFSKNMQLSIEKSEKEENSNSGYSVLLRYDKIAN
jgi:hypothetical protein